MSPTSSFVRNSFEAFCLRGRWQGAFHSRLELINAWRGEMAGGLTATADLPFFTNCCSAFITTRIFRGTWDFIGGQGVFIFRVLKGQQVGGQLLTLTVRI
jgi:hypothetical protein